MTMMLCTYHFKGCYYKCTILLTFFNQFKVKTNFDVNMSKCSPIWASGLPIVWPCEQNVTKI